MLKKYSKNSIFDVSLEENHIQQTSLIEPELRQMNSMGLLLNVRVFLIFKSGIVLFFF